MRELRGVDPSCNSSHVTATQQLLVEDSLGGGVVLGVCARTCSTHGLQDMCVCKGAKGGGVLEGGKTFAATTGALDAE